MGQIRHFPNRLTACYNIFNIWTPIFWLVQFRNPAIFSWKSTQPQGYLGYKLGKTANFSCLNINIAETYHYLALKLRMPVYTRYVAQIAAGSNIWKTNLSDQKFQVLEPWFFRLSLQLSKHRNVGGQLWFIVTHPTTGILVMGICFPIDWWQSPNMFAG